MNFGTLIMMITKFIRLKGRVLNRLKKKLNGVSVRLNANRKLHMRLKKNDMMRIHDKEGNKISECNLLHDIINPTKCT